VPFFFFKRLLPYKHYGYNLFKLKDLQKICIISCFINYAANFIDKFAAQSTKAIFREGEIKELAVTVLKNFKLEILENPEYYEHANKKHFSKYVYNKTIINKLLEATVDNIDDLCDDINLKEKEELQNQFDIVMTEKTYSNLRRELCK
jgi:hypothetical protein